MRDGLEGAADLQITADTRTWLGFLAGERSLVWALLSRKIRLKGPPRLLRAFGSCFPSPGIRHADDGVAPIVPAVRPSTAPYRAND